MKNYIICNKEDEAHFMSVISDANISDNDVVFINNSKVLQGILSASINPDGFVLIDVDANLGEEQNVDYFYGFDIAIDLRRKYKIRNQIIFYSRSYPDFYFLNRSLSDIKFKILFGRGSSFLEFPYTIDCIKEKLLQTRPINSAALYDVVTMLCDLKGVVIDKLTHRLRYEYGIENINQVLDEIQIYLSPEQVQLIELYDFREKLKESIIKDKKEDFYTQKELFLKICLLYLTQSDSIEIESANKSHTILLVDDRKEELENYSKLLSKNFNVLKTTSGEEAIKKITEDNANNIKAIIADWRLFQDDTLTYWQPLQGYEVLDYAAKTGVRALFALTSQADYVVHHIRNLLGIKFWMFKKDNLKTVEQWSLFTDVINEACDETTELISSIPKLAGWTKNEIDTKTKEVKKSLHQQYTERRNSPDWLDYENKITDSCDTIWEYYVAYIEETLDEALQDFPKKFGIVLNNLESILIARRICIALFYNQGKIYQNILGNNYPRIDVYSVFRNKFYKEFIEENEKKGKYKHKGISVEEYTLEKLIEASSNLLNTTLCIEVEELASCGSMLPEEKNWIKSKGIVMSLEYEEDEVEVQKTDKNNQASKDIEEEPSDTEMRDIENNLSFDDADIDDD